jgi:hypothetical protein
VGESVNSIYLKNPSFYADDSMHAIKHEFYSAEDALEKLELPLPNELGVGGVNSFACTAGAITGLMLK